MADKLEVDLGLWGRAKVALGKFIPGQMVGRTLRGSNAAPRMVGKARYTDTWNGLEDMELFIPEERRADKVIKSLKKKVRMFSRTKNRPQIREAGKAHGLSSRKPLPH